MNRKQKTASILSLLDSRKTIYPPKIQPSSQDEWDLLDDSIPAAQETLFSGFNRNHVEQAAKRIEILNKKSFEDFLSAAEVLKTRINDGMFLHILYSYVLHQDNCCGVNLPSILEVAPHWFFSSQAIHKAIQLSIHNPEKEHIVESRRISNPADIEDKLGYFREDVWMNAHHWYWHVVYPTVWDEKKNGKPKDRKGELFYYMHQQMIARYDCERLSNDMKRVLPLHNFYEEIEGYSPQLTSQEIGLHFSTRPHDMVLKDVPGVLIYDLETWRYRIIDAIDKKQVFGENGNIFPLDNLRGIDLLGSLIEASSFSINKCFYGNFHNLGHIIISSIHNPDGRFQDKPGVMGFDESAPRDTIFYRWHKLIDDLFARHKATLKPYSPEQLSFSGVQVQSVNVLAKEMNVVETFMRENFADLSHAHFVKPKSRIQVLYEHLDHEPFSYEINIENNSGDTKYATIRVFLAPKYDEFGKKLELDAKRKLMIELDKFYKELAPGMNTVNRHSSDSSVAPPRIPTFSDLMRDDYEVTPDYCNCGWPQHMLIPRGNYEGMDYELFVMCTDYMEDGINLQPDKKTPYAGAVSYCGSKGQKYPDKKPMGFPFDRSITMPAEEFFTSNRFLTEVKIMFTGFLKQ